MRLLHLGWQQSAALCLLLTVIALALRRFPRLELIRSFAREFSFVMALFGLWQYVGHYVRTHSDGAMERAEQVQRWQAQMHLPDELHLQHLVLPHHWLVRSVNGYYAGAHLTGMACFLIWVWWRHRPDFHRVRNTVAASTLLYLVVQSVPVAPPRLLPGGGFVDTALSYGQSVYGPYEDTSRLIPTLPPREHSARSGSTAAGCSRSSSSSARSHCFFASVPIATSPAELGSPSAPSPASSFGSAPRSCSRSAFASPRHSRRPTGRSQGSSRCCSGGICRHSRSSTGSRSQPNSKANEQSAAKCPPSPTTPFPPLHRPTCSTAPESRQHSTGRQAMVVMM